MVNRVILIVLDSVGIGYLPDADLYKDEGSHTLGHIAKNYTALQIPNLLSLGLGHIEGSQLNPFQNTPLGSYGRAMEKSAGKDTTTGHWEIAGTVLDTPFPTFKEGFPEAFIKDFEKAIGTKTIGNYSASGTEIIMQLGDEHIKTGYPIVYTSADSVFQIAIHEDIFPIEKQYEICETARKMLTGDLAVGRVIARPFEGKSGNYTRTSRRKDFALLPPDNVLTALQNDGKEVIGIGKIHDIFAGKGINKSIKTKTNPEGILATIDCIKSGEGDLIFTNLVDFDMLYGHRRDVDGYAKCLEEFDRFLPEIMESLKEGDWLMITADHGNDPTWHGTDHTREYIPILNYGHAIQKSVNIGTRKSFADIAVSLAEGLGVYYNNKNAQSFYRDIMINRSS
jgi:phosphopentomutase